MKKRKSKRKYGTNKLIIILSIAFAALMAIAVAIVYFCFVPPKTSENNSNTENSTIPSSIVATESTLESTQNTTQSTANGITDIPKESSESSNIDTETKAQSSTSDSDNILNNIISSNDKLSLTPYEVIDNNTGKKTSFTSVFGSAYGDYGGSLLLNFNDNSVKYYMGVDRPGLTNGTFTIDGNKIVVTFENGDKKEIEVVSENNENIFIVPEYGQFSVYFK